MVHHSAGRVVLELAGDAEVVVGRGVLWIALQAERGEVLQLRPAAVAPEQAGEGCAHPGPRRPLLQPLPAEGLGRGPASLRQERVQRRFSVRFSDLLFVRFSGGLSVRIPGGWLELWSCFQTLSGLLARSCLLFGRCEERLNLLDVEEFVSDVVEEGGPIAWSALAEDPQGGVPGRGIALESPAPFGEVLEEEPGGPAHASGEMGEGGVGGENEIATGEDRGGIEEIPGLIDLALDVEEAMAEGAGGELLGAESLL